MKKNCPYILFVTKALKRAGMKLESDLTGFVGGNMLFYTI